MDGGNGFNDWTTFGGQERLYHVIDEDEAGISSQNLNMQQFENLPGYGGKFTPQLGDTSVLALCQSNNFALQNSEISPHPVSQSSQTSLPLPPGYPPLSVNPQDLMLLQTALEVPSMSNSVTSSASLATPGLTSSSSISGSFRNRNTSQSHRPHRHSMTKPHRPQSSRSGSSFNSNPIKEKKLSAKKLLDKAAQIQELLKSECPKFSNHFFKHLKLLVEKEIEDGNLDAEFDEMSLATSTQDSSLPSEVLDSGYPSEAGSTVSSTTRARNLHTQEDMPMDTEPEERVRYYCTFTDCQVVQKECKYRHKKCQCPSKRERYWSHSKVDIKRHEGKEDHWPQNSYLCLPCFVTDLFGNPTCSCCFMALPVDPKMHYIHCERARVNTKTFGRKDHLLGHLQKQHNLKDMGEIAKTWSLPLSTDWPTECGFRGCDVLFASWDQRSAHIAWHFENGSKIQDWQFPLPGPKDTKPRGSFFPTYRRDSDDDGSGGNGGNSRSRAFDNGYPASATQQIQQGQPSSSQWYGPSYQQGHYQQSHRAAQSQLPDSSRHGGVGRQQTGSPGQMKLNMALERYLKDRGDRIPALGAAPRSTNHLSSNPRTRGEVSIASSGQSSMMSGEERAGPIVIDIVLLPPLSGHGKSSLAKHYVDRHWKDLDHGVFWLNSKMQPVVKQSFWEIAAQAISQHSIHHNIIARVFNNSWHHTLHTLRGLSLLETSRKPLLALSPRPSDAVSTMTRKRHASIDPSPRTAKRGRINKLPRKSQPRGDESCKGSTSIRRSPKDTLPLAFVCMFSFAGYNRRFRSKNEWKRHVSSEHLKLDSWVCKPAPCGSVQNHPMKDRGVVVSGSEFNRKDHFTQRLRRMHASPPVQRLIEKNPERGRRLKEFQVRCLSLKEKLPTRIRDGLFEGDRHLAVHMKCSGRNVRSQWPNDPDIYDHVAEFGGDQHGPRLVQQKTVNNAEKMELSEDAESIPRPLEHETLPTNILGESWNGINQTDQDRSFGLKSPIYSRRSDILDVAASASHNEIFIAVLGVTGVGKSSFIGLVSDASSHLLVPRLETNQHGMAATQTNCMQFQDYRGVLHYLIDTPGLNDTPRHDSALLASLLQELQAKVKMASGIVLLMPVGMSCSSKSKTSLFKKVCEQGTLNHVVCKTKWETRHSREYDEQDVEIIPTRTSSPNAEFNPLESTGWEAETGRKLSFREVEHAKSIRETNTCWSYDLKKLQYSQHQGNHIISGNIPSEVNIEQDESSEPESPVYDQRLDKYGRAISTEYGSTPPTAEAPLKGDERVPRFLGRGSPPAPPNVRPAGLPIIQSQLPLRHPFHSIRVSDSTQRPLSENSGRKRLTTSYEAYTIRKTVPRNLREKSTWAKSEITREPLSQEDISRTVKKLNESRQPVQDKKAALMPFQQCQVNRLLDEIMSAELDNNFEWAIAQLDSKAFTNKKGQNETSTITVYVKRAPLKDLNAAGLFNAIEKNVQQSLELITRQQQPWTSSQPTPYPSYPIPIPRGKYQNALKLYHHYRSEAGLEHVHKRQSIKCLTSEESPSLLSLKINNDGVKKRIQRSLSPVAKAKAALVRHLGSCWVCRSRRVPCPLEHHEVNSLDRAQRVQDGIRQQARFSRTSFSTHAGEIIPSVAFSEHKSVRTFIPEMPGPNDALRLSGYHFEFNPELFVNKQKRQIDPQGLVEKTEPPVYEILYRQDRNSSSNANGRSNDGSLSSGMPLARGYSGNEVGIISMEDPQQYLPLQEPRISVTTNDLTNLGARSMPNSVEPRLRHPVQSHMTIRR